MVYIVPDRTKLEHTKYKRVVEELKRRKANGKTNLIIRNGVVTERQPRLNKNAQTDT